MKRDACVLGLVVLVGTILQLVMTYLLRTRGSLPVNIRILPNINID